MTNTLRTVWLSAGGRFAGGPLRRVAAGAGGEHPVQLRHVEVAVGDDGIVGRSSLSLLDVARPLLVLPGRVDRESDDLDVPPVELGLDLGHVAQLGRADRREVLRMREQDRPRVTDPLVEVNRPLRGLGGEVRGDVPKRKTHVSPSSSVLWYL